MGDDGARIQRLGVGFMIDAKDYNYPKAKGKIESLLSNHVIVGFITKMRWLSGRGRGLPSLTTAPIIRIKA